MLWLPCLQTVMMKFSFHLVLLWFRVVVKRFLFPALCFVAFPPLPIPLVALALSRRLVAVADTLLGIVNIDLLLLLLLLRHHLLLLHVDPLKISCLTTAIPNTSAGPLWHGQGTSTQVQRGP
jgi:hypothetical protein